METTKRMETMRLRRWIFLTVMLSLLAVFLNLFSLEVLLWGALVIAWTGLSALIATVFVLVISAWVEGK